MDVKLPICWYKVNISNLWIKNMTNSGTTAVYSQLDLLDIWCETNVGPKNVSWFWEFPNYIFRREDDAVAFKLANIL